jgi:hypothetical protein
MMSAGRTYHYLGAMDRGENRWSEGQGTGHGRRENHQLLSDLFLAGVGVKSFLEPVLFSPHFNTSKIKNFVFCGCFCTYNIRVALLIATPQNPNNCRLQFSFYFKKVITKSKSPTQTRW